MLAWFSVYWSIRGRIIGNTWLWKFRVGKCRITTCATLRHRLVPSRMNLHSYRFAIPIDGTPFVLPLMMNALFASTLPFSNHINPEHYRGDNIGHVLHVKVRDLNAQRIAKCASDRLTFDTTNGFRARTFAILPLPRLPSIKTGRK